MGWGCSLINPKVLSLKNHGFCFLFSVYILIIRLHFLIINEITSFFKIHDYWTCLNTYSIPTKGKRKEQKVYDFHCNICNRDFQNCTNASSHVKSCKERFQQLKKVQSYTIMNAFDIEDPNIY